MAGAAILWPSWVERRLEPLRHRVLQHEAAIGKPRAERRWRLWQVETSMACNLGCVMCPWKQIREQTENRALLSDETWERIRPHLGEVAAIDFTGGGEPTLHPRLPDLVAEAASAGCRTGFLSNGMLLDEELARRLIDAGIEWLTFSIDGADASTYEAIRPGASFELVTSNIRRLAAIRSGRTPRIGINFVMMQENAHQLEAIVELAAALGASFVTFKQCDVIRGELGRDHGLFRPAPDAGTRRLERQLERAKKLAGRLGLETSSFSFTPDEQPVCEQDPRNSVFIRWDGGVAPCINQAYGGSTCFLGRKAEMPTVLHGNLNEDDALELWEGASCLHYRTTFADRVASYDHEFQLELLGEGLSRISRAEQAARAAMKDPPHGCDVCHYLYDV
jgi:MoaA/NifB/PqqE/SkfB family radical SAM enzyme